MSRSIPLWFCVFPTVTACSTDPSLNGAQAGCEPNPEKALAEVANVEVGPGSRTLNRIAVNRIAVNRISVNRTAHNRIAVNRIAVNRIAVNGAALDGVVLSEGRIQALRDSSNELVGLASDGRHLRGEDFVGATVIATLGDGTEVELDVTRFERTDNPQVVNYELRYQGENLCEAGIGMFVPGYWDESATYHAADEQGVVASYTCVDGMIGKCVNWGYASWIAGSDLHAACVRMGTADYCGTGVSFTKDGTAIDFYDNQALQTPEGDESFLFEGGWSPSGAVCVNRPRYAAISTAGEPVLPSCFSELPKCESWDAALARGAIIGNSSRLQARLFCN